MTTKITAIFDTPVDTRAFEAGYADMLALAMAVPGRTGSETSKVWPKEDGSAAPAYRLLDLYFADYDSASQAVTTTQAGTFFGCVLALATGGVRVVFADVETTSSA